MCARRKREVPVPRAGRTDRGVPQIMSALEGILGSTPDSRRCRPDNREKSRRRGAARDCGPEPRCPSRAATGDPGFCSQRMSHFGEDTSTGRVRAARATQVPPSRRAAGEPLRAGFHRARKPFPSHLRAFSGRESVFKSPKWSDSQRNPVSLRCRPPRVCAWDVRASWETRGRKYGKP